ncbi:MAG: hypothetical protein RR192_02540, partial [Peptostreptococcaceae bacterium]
EEVSEYEEIEYIEVEEDDDREYEEYEEIEYIEVEEDDDMEDSQDTNYNYVSENKGSVADIDDRDNDHSEYEYANIEDYGEIEYTKTNKIFNKNKYIKDRHQKHRNTQLDEETSTQKKVQDDPITNNRVPGTLLMPRQIKKGLKYFREVKPFVDDYVDSTRWWKIDITPATLCGYTMPYLGYLNSLNFTMYSDAIMQAYKYRHYLFGVQYDEYNKRKNYIYAVPGKKEEQPDQGHTGFSVYQPCDTRNNSLGYWLCYIDSRSRKILK